MRENQVIGVLGRYLEPGGEGGLATVNNGQCEQAWVRECLHGRYL